MKTELSVIYNIPFILAARKTIIGLSKTFKDKRQRNNFINLLSSLIIQGTPILSRVNEIDNSKIPWFKRLSHFLKNTCSPDKVKTIYQSFISKHLKDLAYIALDWTALVKNGKCFEFECIVHDSRDDREHDGFPLLLASGFSADKKLWLPLLWKLASWIQPGFMSENNIICEFIKQLAKFLKKIKKIPIFLADRGFARKPIIATLLQLKLLFVIQACENRLIILEDGTKTKLGNLKRGFYQNVLIKAWDIKLNIVVCGNGKNRRILLTNLSKDKYSVSDIRKIFSTRGKIEPNIKEIKQDLGLEKFMVRSFQAIDNLIGLILLAYAISQIIFSKFRKLLLWARRKILHYKLRVQRLTADIVRRLLRRIALFGLSEKFMLKLAKYRPCPP